MGRDQEHDDEIVTRAAAMVITWLRRELKNEIGKALKELRHEFWRDVLDYMLRENWVRIVTAIAFAVSAVVFYMRDMS